jgi:hypothetical protein
MGFGFKSFLKPIRKVVRTVGKAAGIDPSKKANNALAQRIKAENAAAVKKEEAQATSSKRTALRRTRSRSAAGQRSTRLLLSPARANATSGIKKRTLGA